MLGENNLIVFRIKRSYHIIDAIDYNTIIKKKSFYNGKRIQYKETFFYFSNDILQNEMKNTDHSSTQFVTHLF